ncbi:MAG: DEAD/DEAH box helicase family protein [Xenococcaceae cyanobacterium MO_207.B15]|nr:DEAD/DEAH box helicase family protein [Xenococcaceae cyanobacterium MO_207.B15]
MKADFLANNYFLNYYQLVLSRLLSGATSLYPHQKAALLALHQKASQGKMDEVKRQAGLILAGVGTGKTLIQTVTPYILSPWMKGKQVLYLSDNCTLKSRFLKDFPTTAEGRPVYEEWLLYSLNILPPGVPPPKIIELDTKNFHKVAFLLNKADVLVGNRQFVINLVKRGDIQPDSVGLIVVDEAHFAAASSYRSITNYFNRALLTYFTGSKFRSDSQPIPNVEYEIVRDEVNSSVVKYAPKADFEFTLQQAWKLNPPPIKQIAFKEAHSSKLLIEEDGEEHEYDFEEFIAKAQIDNLWFRRIILADNFCLPVLDKAVEILLSKRKATEQPHAMIVRALNIKHVHHVASLLEKRFPFLTNKVGLIHSQHETYDTEGRASDIINKFYNGEFWVLVHCGTLGVGFDHKWASVSCCLCVFRTMSPAEQEWGRIIRRVPGAAPIADKPELDAPNWGVIVTHSALSMKSLFSDFIYGKKADIISEISSPTKTRPILTTTYEAGETLLNLSETQHLRPGDVLELSVLTDPKPNLSNTSNELNGNGFSQSNNSELEPLPPINSSDDLTDIDNIQNKRIELAYPEDFSPFDNQVNGQSNQLSLPALDNSNTASSLGQKPWEKEVNAIVNNLKLLKQTRVFKIQVESVLDDNTVTVVPTWNDIPTGALLSRTHRNLSEPDVNFLDHINLDWQIMIDGELISYSQYKKRVVLASKGLELNEDGDICANGVSLKLTLGKAYSTFLKGLETEISSAKIEVPHTENSVARPDIAKNSLQSKYGGQIRGLIYDVLNNSYLIPDGSSGCSLVENPVPLITEAINRVIESGNEPSFKNNSQLIHSAVFGYIKEKTGRSFAEHTEQQYAEVKNLVRSYLNKLQFQLHNKRQGKSI